MRVSVPGKAMLAGEYAVLLPGEPCLVAAVEKQLFVTATPSTQWEVRSEHAIWRGGAAPAELTFAVAAAQAASERFGSPPLELRTEDHLHIDGQKLGLGGSAAVTVAVTRAVAGPGALSADVWEVADRVHRELQGGKGSGADIAASMFGGILRYTSQPRVATPVKVHPDVRLLLVWTGSSAKTAPRLGLWEGFVATRPKDASAFAANSRQAVTALEQGIERGDRDLIRGGIGQARAALNGLEPFLGAEIETEPLRLAAEVAWRAGAAGKLSGAGGGDCAIVLAVGVDEAERASRALQGVGLKVFAVDWSHGGARAELDA